MANHAGGHAGLVGRRHGADPVHAGRLPPIRVDGDGDGKRDIWRSLPTCSPPPHFLAAHGWKPGQPWGAEVRLPAKFDWELAEIDVTKTVAEWRKLGVKRIDGKALPQGRPRRPPIIAPAGHRGPAFIRVR